MTSSESPSPASPDGGASASADALTSGDIGVRSAPSAQELADSAAAAVYELIVQLQSPVREQGSSTRPVGPDGAVRIVLTGGSLGIAVCRSLRALHSRATGEMEQGSEGTGPQPSGVVDWRRVHVFFGDERFRPVDHPDRNDAQADDALLRHIPIPEGNIHRYAAPAAGEPADGPALDDAARAYAEELRTWAPHGFDLHLLGMGPEGHINSLFPHTPELVSAETVVAVRGCPKPPPERVSLTLTAVHSARRVWLLVAGDGKREAASHVLSGDDGAQWPAVLAVGADETLLWVDAAADPRPQA